MREHRPVSTQRVIAGIDGSSGADAALRWAAAEADLRDAELVALMAWGFLDQHPVPGHEGFDPKYGEADAAAGGRASTWPGRSAPTTAPSP